MAKDKGNIKYSLDGNEDSVLRCLSDAWDETRREESDDEQPISVGFDDDINADELQAIFRDSMSEHLLPVIFWINTRCEVTEGNLPSTAFVAELPALQEAAEELGLDEISIWLDRVMDVISRCNSYTTALKKEDYQDILKLKDELAGVLVLKPDSSLWSALIEDESDIGEKLDSLVMFLSEEECQKCFGAGITTTDKFMNAEALEVSVATGLPTEIVEQKQAEISQAISDREASEREKAKRPKSIQTIKQELHQIGARWERKRDTLISKAKCWNLTLTALQKETEQLKFRENRMNSEVELLQEEEQDTKEKIKQEKEKLQGLLNDLTNLQNRIDVLLNQIAGNSPSIQSKDKNPRNEEDTDTGPVKRAMG